MLYLTDEQKLEDLRLAAQTIEALVERLGETQQALELRDRHARERAAQLTEALELADREKEKRVAAEEFTPIV